MPELLFEKRETTLLPAASGGVSASAFIMTMGECLPQSFPAAALQSVHLQRKEICRV